MSRNVSVLKTMLSLALIGSVNLACAEVLRCSGETGGVSYTDSACDQDAPLAEAIVVEKPAVTNVIYPQPLKAAQARATNWAELNLPPRAGKVDKESVRSARLRMISLDGTSNYWDARK